MIVSTAAFAPDGQRFLWGGGTPGEKCLASVCDAGSHKPLFQLIGHKKPLLKARFLNDGTIVTFSFDSEIRHWSAAGELLSTNGVRLSHRSDGFDISPDGTLAAAGDYRGLFTGWRISDGAEKFAKTEPDDTSPIESAACAPDGGLWATGSAAGGVRFWTARGKRPKHRHDFGIGHHIQGLAWSPDGTCIAVAIVPDGHAEDSARARIVLLGTEDFQEIVTLFPNGHEPYCVAFSPDGKLLAAAGGGTDRGGNESKANCVIHVWNVRSHKKVFELSGHTGLVRDVAFAPDSQTLISAAWDQTVRIWSLRP